jgi:hypothetical protein
MGWAARNPVLQETNEVRRGLRRIQLLMAGVTSEYQLDAMLRREVPDEAKRAEVRKLLYPMFQLAEAQRAAAAKSSHKPK